MAAYVRASTLSTYTTGTPKADQPERYKYQDKQPCTCEKTR